MRLYKINETLEYSEEYETTITKYLPECHYKSLTREKINELLKEYRETIGGEEDENI